MMRVLLADDDEAFREALQEALLEQGFEVQLASTVDEVCEAVQAETFDVVVSDVCMPGDGTTLVARLRGIRPETPVVLISAHDQPALRERALADGAFDYCTKPIDLGGLRATLQRASARRAGGQGGTGRQE